MKKTTRIIAALLCASASGLAYAGTPIEASALPKAATQFIAKHFPEEKIYKVEQDKGYRGPEYDVDFYSGAEVEFTEDGQWKDIKAARGNAVPAALIPAAIAKYVKTNFEGQQIVEISRRRGGYEIELANGTELRLTEDAKQMPARGQGGHRGQGAPQGPRHKN